MKPAPASAYIAGRYSARAHARDLLASIGLRDWTADQESRVTRALSQAYLAGHQQEVEA